MWVRFHASDTYKVSSDSDIMPNLTIHFRTSGLRGPAVHLHGISFPSELRRKKESALLFCVRSELGVWCSVRLFQLSWKKLLGNRNGHRPGSLSGKWNPESGSQTSNHTFKLFIHSYTSALPETPEGGEQKCSMIVGKSTCLRRK